MLLISDQVARPFEGGTGIVGKDEYEQTRQIFSVGFPLPRKRLSSDNSPSCWNSMFANMDDYSVVYCSAPEIVSEECARPDFDLKDMQTHLEQLRIQITDCELIRDTATDKAERELFEKFSLHFKVLATEIERAITRTKDLT